MYFHGQGKEEKNTPFKYRLFFKAKTDDQSFGTKIPEARAKRHRNRHRAMRVCVGEVSTR